MQFRIDNVVTYEYHAGGNDFPKSQYLDLPKIALRERYIIDMYILRGAL